MAQRIVPLTAVVPANTPIATPHHFPLQFPSSEVERIDVRIPPGPSGFVGFAINNGGGNFIPDINGTWVVADDQYIQWPLEGAPNNGNWDITAYNTDVLDHTLYFFFLISDLVSTTTPQYGGLVAL